MVVIFHGRASFDSFAFCIIGKAFYLKTHEMFGYFPNHREENVCTSIRVFFARGLEEAGDWVEVMWNFLIHLISQLGPVVLGVFK